MKVKTVTVSMGRTVNMGNYESARWDFSMEVEVDEGEDVEKVKRDSAKVVNEWDDTEFMFWSNKKKK